MRGARLLAALAIAVALAAGCAEEMGPPPPPLPQITSAWPWQRHAGNPIVLADAVPVARGVYNVGLSDPCVLYDEGRFRLWFAYGGRDLDGGIRVRTGYGESDDGVAWRLSLAALEPSGRGWDKTNAETPSVVKDPRLPPGHPRRYRLYYAGLDHELQKASFDKVLKAGMLYAIGLAFSPDGRRFTRLPAAESPYGVEGLVLKPNPPELERDTDELFNIADPHVVVKDGRYYLWYTAQGRKVQGSRTFASIGHATSDDGVRWTKHGTVLRAELPWEIAHKEPGVGRPYVLWTGQRFEMFYDAAKTDDNPDNNSAAGIGFATSADGRTWQKLPQPVFVGTGGRGERRGVYIGSAVLLKDGAYRLYYAGADEWQRYSLNLATVMRGSADRRRPGAGDLAHTQNRVVR